MSQFWYRCYAEFLPAARQTARLEFGVTYLFMISKYDTYIY